jgi:hypothetical protein
MNNKIKIQRQINTDEKLVKSAIFLFFISIICYVIMNVSVVFELISYKKTKAVYEEKSEMYSILEKDINKFKNNMDVSAYEKNGLVKTNSSNFVVRKDYLGGLSFNYESR